MRAGDLTHRVVLQRGTETSDSFGAGVMTWTNLATVWAKLEWLPGSESLHGDRDHADVPVRIMLRRGSNTISLRERDRVLVAQGATQITTTLSKTATSLVVNTPGVFPPDADFTLRIGDELVKVTAGAGTSASPYTISRASYGTAAAVHEAGKSAVHMLSLDIESVTPVSPQTIELTASRSSMRVA